MKTVSTILKVLAALAVIAGIVYVIATYGDKIVAWAKKVLHICPCKNECDDCECDGDCFECECDGCEKEAFIAADDDFEG